MPQIRWSIASKSRIPSMASQTTNVCTMTRILLCKCTAFYESTNIVDHSSNEYPNQIQFISYPEEEATGMFITTRLTESTESTGGCDLRLNTCKYNLVGQEDNYFIACIENFTVLQI